MKVKLMAVLVLCIAALGVGLVVGTDAELTKDDLTAIDIGVGTKAVSGWVRNAGTSTLQVHWSREGEPGGALGYNIYRSTDGVIYVKITSSPVWPDYYDENLKSGTYFYRIYLVNSDGTETFWVGPLVGFIF